MSDKKAPIDARHNDGSTRSAFVLLSDGVRQQWHEVVLQGYGWTSPHDSYDVETRYCASGVVGEPGELVHVDVDTGARDAVARWCTTQKVWPRVMQVLHPRTPTEAEPVPQHAEGSSVTLAGIPFEAGLAVLASLAWQCHVSHVRVRTNSSRAGVYCADGREFTVERQDRVNPLDELRKVVELAAALHVLRNLPVLACVSALTSIAEHHAARAAEFNHPTMGALRALTTASREAHHAIGSTTKGPRLV